MAKKYVINHLNIAVTDIDRSLYFYTDVLGFKYVKNLGEKKACLRYNGFDFFIEEVSQVRINPEVHFGFKTNKQGVYEFARFLKKKNVNLTKGNNPKAEVYEMPNSNRVALYFEDLDHHTIEVYSDI